MATNGSLIEKQVTVNKLTEETIQARHKDEQDHGVSIFNFLVKAGELISPWWSPRRDLDLSRFVLMSDHMSGAIYKVITRLVTTEVHILPRDPAVKAQRVLAEEYQMRLIEGSEFSQGWLQLATKFYDDGFSQDNGAFMEVIGDGPKNGPIIGPALGLASLDSQRCTRTSSAEFPVIYYDTDGKRYKLHFSRVIFTSQLPSTRAQMNNVGLCWVSRAINAAQNLVDIAIYKQEKLGSRPLRQMLIGQGLTAEQIWQAVYSAEESMDNQALRRYAKNVVIGSQTNTDIDVIIKDLASVPDHFNERDATELGMFTIALTGGFPPRDLWPATTTGATRADAQFQHVVGGSGYRVILDCMAQLLGGSPTGDRQMGGKFLPPTLKVIFDFLDDDQDKLKAENEEIRSKTRNTNLVNGVTDIRTERELMVQGSEITKQQFDRLELDDGRLPSGVSVLALFLSGDSQIQSLLRLPFGDPLNTEANAGIKDFAIEQIDNRILQVSIEAVNAGRASQQIKAEQALAALKRLKGEYEETNGEIEEETLENIDE